MQIVIVTIIVIVACVAALWKTVKFFRRKNAVSCCSCGCSHCNMLPNENSNGEECNEK